MNFLERARRVLRVNNEVRLFSAELIRKGYTDEEVADAMLHMAFLLWEMRDEEAA